MTITILNYTFEGPFTNSSSLQNKSGVYAILRLASNGNYDVIDVGESGAVKNRIENDHERAPCWRRENYSHMAALYVDATDRMRIEQEIRTAYNPPCGKR